MNGQPVQNPAAPYALKSALQRVLTAAAAAEMEQMLDRLWSSGRFTVDRAPQAGLVMCSVIDPFDTPFHLGEVLVTRADVRFDGCHRGCGVVCGDEPDPALLLAAVEAAERGGATRSWVRSASGPSACGPSATPDRPASRVARRRPRSGSNPCAGNRWISDRWEAETMDPSSARNQTTYRALLQALSRPGCVVRLDGLEMLSPLASIRAVVDCLLDHEVGVCLLGARPAADALSAAVAATGASLVPVDRADFLVVDGSDSRGRLTEARRGSYEYPEDGATVIYSLDGAGVPSSDRFRVRLEGPGVAEAGGRVPDMRGVPVPELRALSEVNADYPLGVDAFFVRPSGEVMAIPRSTRIQVR